MGEVHVSAQGHRRRVIDLGGEGLGGLADQIGVGDAAKQREQVGDAAVLGAAARDPPDARIAGQGLFRRVRVGGLGIVDEQHAAEAGDRLHPMSQAGEGQQAPHRLVAAEPYGAHGGVGAGGVLGVVAARQGDGRGQVGDALVPLHQPTTAQADPVHVVDARHPSVVAVRRRHCDRDEGGQPPGDALAIGVIDADHGDGALGLFLKDAALGGHIAGHAAVAVQMVRADVGQHRHVRAEAAGQVQLVGRDLDHIDGVRRRLGQGQHPDADVAPHMNRAARLAEDPADQGGGGGLAVGAGDGDDLGPLHLGQRRQGAGEQLDVAHDPHARVLGHLDGPVGRGMCQGGAGRQDQGGELRPVRAGQVLDREAFGLGLEAAGQAVVPQHGYGAPGPERAGGGQTAAPQPENRDAPSFKTGDGDHGYLSFSVDRPMRASMAATIQKRTTTVDSAQPIFSKWWWMGAIRKMRFPVALK